MEGAGRPRKVNAAISVREDGGSPASEALRDVDAQGRPDEGGVVGERSGWGFAAPCPALEGARGRQGRIPCRFGIARVKS